MAVKLRFFRKTVIFILALVLLPCPSSLFSSKALALSIDEENKMGQEFLAQIRRHSHLLNDNFANNYINNLGHYLIRPLETRLFPFHFYIIKDNTLNAFAAPGGHIFFYSGLISAMESLDELAAVMCHEIGHISARHLSNRIEKSKKIGYATMAGILAGMLIGGEAAGALVTGSMAAGMQTQLNYSRADERQADQLGFKYMKAAGFDPGGMLIILKKFETEHMLSPHNAPAYLLTHPTGPERMSNLDTMLQGYTPGPPKKEAVELKMLFPFFRAIIIAKSLDHSEAADLFAAELKKDPLSSSANFGLGLVYREESDYETAVHYLKKALKQGKNSSLLLTNLGETYQKNGRDREAVSALEKALEVDDVNGSTLFLLGVSYENLGQYEKAVRVFERLAAFKPVNKNIYYHLGISYGRQGRLGLAHYFFGLYFKKMGKRDKAIFHFQKAKEHSGDDKALKKKIRNGMDKLPPARRKH